MEAIENSKIIYSTSFFITSNWEAMKIVMQYCAKANKPFGLNLSACFLIEFNTAQVLEALEYADYIFCNEDEAACYAKVQKIEYKELKEVALALTKYKKANDKRPRVAIVT